MTGDFDSLGDREILEAFFFETYFGPIELGRIALLLAIVVVAFVPAADRIRMTLTMTLSALLLVSQAWLGHAAQGGRSLAGGLMIAAYATHALAAGAWSGSLPSLLMAIRESRQRPFADSHAQILRLLLRYSTMATLAVALVVTSGVANAAFRVGGQVSALLSTTYGEVLTAKVSLVALMLCFAAYNRFVAIRALGSERPVIGRLTISTACELAIGVLVLGLAAILGITPPPG